MQNLTILLKSFIIYSKLIHYQQKILVKFEKTHIIFSLNTDNKFYIYYHNMIACFAIK